MTGSSGGGGGGSGGGIIASDAIAELQTNFGLINSKLQDHTRELIEKCNHDKDSLSFDDEQFLLRRLGEVDDVKQFN